MQTLKYSGIIKQIVFAVRVIAPHSYRLVPLSVITSNEIYILLENKSYVSYITDIHVAFHITSVYNNFNII